MWDLGLQFALRPHFLGRWRMRIQSFTEWFCLTDGLMMSSLAIPTTLVALINYMSLLQTHKTPFVASKNVFPGVDICYLAARRWEMSFSAVNVGTVDSLWKPPKKFRLSVAGNDGPLTCSAVILIFWLISLVSISLWIWSRSRSPKRLETYILFTCIRISSESLAIMIGISKLPYCSDLTSKASSPWCYRLFCRTENEVDLAYPQHGC